MKFFRKQKKLLTYLFFPAFCFLLYNSAANFHSHYIKGNIVSHAHPYQKSADKDAPFPTHKHSDFEFFILHQIYHFFQFIVGITGLTFLLAQIRFHRIYIFSENFVQSIYGLNSSLRAPPLSF